MLHLHLWNFQVVLKFNFDIDCEVAPTHSSNQERRLLYLNYWWRESRVQRISNLLYVLRGFLSISIRKHHVHSPSVWVLHLWIGSWRLWILNILMSIANWENNLFDVILPIPTQNQLLLSRQVLCRDSFLNFSLQLLINFWSKKLVEIGSAQRTSHAHVHNRFLAFVAKEMFAGRDDGLHAQLQTNWTLVVLSSLSGRGRLWLGDCRGSRRFGFRVCCCFIDHYLL